MYGAIVALCLFAIAIGVIAEVEEVRLDNEQKRRIRNLRDHGGF